MFYPKGKLYTKKNRGRDRPLCLDSIDLMAEREGFEPPIALRLCLISSQNLDVLQRAAIRRIL